MLGQGTEVLQILVRSETFYMQMYFSNIFFLKLTYSYYTSTFNDTYIKQNTILLGIHNLDIKIS